MNYVAYKSCEFYWVCQKCTQRNKGFYIMKLLLALSILLAWSSEAKITKQTKFGNVLSNCIPEVHRPNCHGKTRERTIDGTCNNLLHTKWGAARTALLRMAKPSYEGPCYTHIPRGFHLHKKGNLPSPYEIIKNVFHVLGKDYGNRIQLSLFHVTFGQFLTHDTSYSPNPGSSSCNAKPRCKPGSYKDFQYPCFPIKKSSKFDRGCTPFVRTFPICPKRKSDVREQVNLITSYIDASTVYGSSHQLTKRLRTNDGSGKLRTSGKNLLPMDKYPRDDCKSRGGCFLAGDARANEHIALASIHTIFLREHNRIAAGLKKLNRHWKGDKIFQTTRKIIGAIVQHITYKEYLPTLVKLPRYRRYNQKINAGVINAFSTASFRFGHSEVPNFWPQLGPNFDSVRPDMSIRDMFWNNKLIFKHGIESTCFGMVGNASETVDMNYAEGVAEKLFIPSNKHGSQSLLAYNIQRGRDHGLPGYNKYRKLCGLRPAKTFHQLSKEIPLKARKALKKVYRRVDDIDLYVGGMAEKHVRGQLVGPTFSCIIKKQFQKFRDGDRFYYERPGVFTRRQLRELKKVSMSKLLCRNLKTVVSMQKNVFLQNDFIGYKKNSRRECSSALRIDLRPWLEQRRGYHRDSKAEINDDETDDVENDDDENDNFTDNRTDDNSEHVTQKDSF